MRFFVVAALIAAVSVVTGGFVGADEGGSAPTGTKTTVKETSLGKIEDNIGIVISPDARRFACVVKRDKKEMVVVDGKGGKAYRFVLDLKYSPDSSHLAYWASTGEKHIFVFDGKESEAYDGYRGLIEFSPDSKHFAYVRCNGGKYRLIVDGQECGGDYDDSPEEAPVVFDSPTKCHVILKKKGEPFLVEAAIKE
jgi:hypothetical protein